MRGFIGVKTFEVDVDPSETEIGGNLVRITGLGVGERMLVLGAQFRDCISGNDKGWVSISPEQARTIIRERG